MPITECVIEGIRRDVSILSKGLSEHILRVEEIAVGLAKAHGTDVQKVRVGALLHDLARAKRPEELLAIAEGFGLEVGPLEEQMPIFLHGPIAAYLASEQYEIDDQRYWRR